MFAFVAYIVNDYNLRSFKTCITLRVLTTHVERFVFWISRPYFCAEKYRTNVSRSGSAFQSSLLRKWRIRQEVFVNLPGKIQSHPWNLQSPDLPDPLTTFWPLGPPLQKVPQPQVQVLIVHSSESANKTRSLCKSSRSTKCNMIS